MIIVSWSTAIFPGLQIKRLNADSPHLGRAIRQASEHIASESK
jgi:hypothetical protein